MRRWEMPVAVIMGNNPLRWALIENAPPFIQIAREANNCADRLKRPIQTSVEHDCRFWMVVFACNGHVSIVESLRWSTTDRQRKYRVHYRPVANNDELKHGEGQQNVESVGFDVSASRPIVVLASGG